MSTASPETAAPVNVAAPAGSNVNGEAESGLLNVNIDEVTRIDLENIWIDPTQNVRHLVSDGNDGITELAASIEASNGLLQAVGVVKITPVPTTGNKEYLLAYGYRRCAALKFLAIEDPEGKWDKNVRCQLVGINTNADLKMIQLIENYSRKDLSPIELAGGLKMALTSPASVQANGMKLFYTQKQLGKMLGIDEAAISQHLKMLDLPREVQDMIRVGDISFSHARELMYPPGRVPADQLVNEANLGKGMKLGKFQEHLKNEYGVPDSDDGDKDSSGSGSSGNSGSQKTSKTLGAGTLKNDFLEFLKVRVEKADPNVKAYTAKDLELARVDAINTVLCVGGTQLATDIEPYMQQKAKAEELARATKDRDDKQASWLHELCKKVEAIINAKITDINQVRPSLQTALTTVITNEGTVREADRGFPMPADIGNILLTAFQAFLQKKSEDAKKSAERKAKKEADEAAKAAADKASGATEAPAAAATEGPADAAAPAATPAEAAAPAEAAVQS